MKVPCEIAVWYLLPSIRRKFAVALVEDYNFSQREAALRMGVTESAVSQYMKSKRGSNLVLPGGIDGSREVEGAILEISKAHDDAKVIKNICAICRLVKNSGSLCGMHKERDDNLSNCRVCMNVEGCR